MELTKHYGSTHAVDGLTFTVRPGQVTGFLGPNGAGKSTTMRMILDLDAPTSGSVTVGGKRLRDVARPLHHIGALLDATAVPGGRRACDHLAAIARSNGIGWRRVTEVLDEVGLAAVARKRVGGFSLGMKQRLGIAAALLGDPAVLMFDEPVNGLDPEGIRWVRELFRSLAAQGRTVLVSSHLMSEMALTADHLVVIGRGRLIADTAVADFIATGSSHRILVRTPYGGELARLLAAAGASIEPAPEGRLAIVGSSPEQVGDLAAKHGLPVYELRTEYASLEEVFMELTADSVDYSAQQPVEH
jgi:ABC-2 type transport system ATP-binding protein